MLKCPYGDCKSKEIESIGYTERYNNGELTCLTYECQCRSCGRLFTHSETEIVKRGWKQEDCWSEEIS
jgi:hypothetical protein